MTTPFLDITTAVRDALLVAPAVAGGRVVRGKATPIAIDKASGVFVNALRAKGKFIDMAGASTQWDFLVTVGAYAKAVGTQDAEEAVDPLLLELYARLSAIEPPPGCGQITLQPGIDWDGEMADQNIGGIVLTLGVRLQTTGAALAPI